MSSVVVRWSDRRSCTGCTRRTSGTPPGTRHTSAPPGRTLRCRQCTPARGERSALSRKRRPVVGPIHRQVHPHRLVAPQAHPCGTRARRSVVRARRTPAGGDLLPRSASQARVALPPDAPCVREGLRCKTKTLIVCAMSPFQRRARLCMPLSDVGFIFVRFGV